MQAFGICLVLGMGALTGSVGADGWNLLAGGGSSDEDCDLADGDWSDEIFAAFVSRASTSGPNEGNGRVVVLDVIPDPECHDTTPGDIGLCTLLECHGASQAVGLCVTRTGSEPGCLEADGPSTAAQIVGFDGVWFRGGDQSLYRDEWEGTATAPAVEAVWSAGGIVGGTSAGAMIQSEIVSTGDAPSWEATSDPWAAGVELGPGPFSTGASILAGALVDTHFTRRARLGRLATFVAREAADQGRDLLGIGVDQETALLVAPDRTASVLGEGAVSFVHLRDDSVLDLAASEPPSARDLALFSLTAGGTVDLATRVGAPSSEREVPRRAPERRDPRAERGVPARILEGAAAEDAGAGSVTVADGGDPAALYRGDLVVETGDGDFQGAVLSTVLEDDTDFRENRAGGPLWAIASDGRVDRALFLDGFDGASCNAIESVDPEVWRALPGRGCPAEQAVVVVDCCSAEWASVSSADPDGNGSPRQSVGLGGCTVSLVASGRGDPEYVPRCARGRSFADGFESGDTTAWTP